MLYIPTGFTGLGRSCAVVWGPEDNLRFADQPQVIGSDHTKSLVLLKICRIKRDCSYLPIGTLRRTSSKKFSREMPLLCDCQYKTT
jgi:hypothetical protein